MKPDHSKLDEELAKKQKEQMEEENQHISLNNPVMQLDKDLKNLSRLLCLEIITNSHLIQAFKFISLEYITDTIRETLKHSRETISIAQNIHGRIVEAKNIDNKLSFQEACYIKNKLENYILTTFKKHREVFFSELQSILKNNAFFPYDYFEYYKDSLTIVKVKFNEALNIKEVEKLLELLDDVFSELERDLLPTFFDTQYQSALTLAERHQYLTFWLSKLKEKILALPKHKDYQYAKMAKNILYDEKTTFTKSFYRDNNTENNNVNLWRMLKYEIDNASEPTEVIKTLKNNNDLLMQKISEIELELTQYSWLTGITSSLIRLWTNTQYYAFGLLANSCSKELVANASRMNFWVKATNKVSQFEATMGKTVPGAKINQILQNIDQRVGDLDSVNAVALSLLFIDQFVVRWLGSADFMLANSLANSFFTDLGTINQLGKRFNIATKTTVNTIEPVSKFIVDLAIFMTITFGKQLLKSDEKISKSAIIFIAGMYILSRLSQDWVGKKFDQIARQSSKEKKGDSSLFSLMKFIVQFVSSSGIGITANKVFRPLFFKPSPPAEQVYSKKYELEPSKVLSPNEYLLFLEMIHIIDETTAGNCSNFECANSHETTWGSNLLNQ